MFSEMNSKERVMAVINNKDFDVYPIINPTSIVTVDSMNIAKSYFPKAHLSASAMAKLAAVGHDYFGFDSVAPYFSVHLEAQALGAKIDWGDENTTPKVIGRIVENVENFDIPNDFIEKNEFQTLIKACKILKKKYNNDVPVIGKVIGPWTLAYHLYGVENLILDTILEPQKTKIFINKLSQIPIEFAKAQFDAGADIVTWAEHCTADLVSREIYEEFVLPIHKKAFNKLNSYGPVVLHICGNIMDRLDLIASSGTTIFHIDSRNDIPKALEIVGNKILLTGSINNPFVLSQGFEKDVKKQAKYCIDSGIKLISPECAIPCNVPKENLLTLVQTVHNQKGIRLHF